MLINDPLIFYKEVTSNECILGIDPGTKRIGLAISDINKKISSPLTTLEKIKYTDMLEELEKIKNQYLFGGIVIGNPINMDGTIGKKSQSSNSLANNLVRDMKMPVLLWDERLSTSAVEKMLIDADISRKRRKAIIDKLSATYILQGYLDYLVINL